MYAHAQGRTIYITSLSLHRIDEMLADLTAYVLKSVGLTVKRELPSTVVKPETAILLVFNGICDMSNTHTVEVLKAMRLYPSMYFIDDHTVWVPEDTNIGIVTQFLNIHPLKDKADIINKAIYKRNWQISKLGSHIDKIISIPKFTSKCSRPYSFVYWGHWKEERKDMYKKYIPNFPSTLIISDSEEFRELLPKATFVPYIRDMRALYTYISLCSTTVVFGDKYHAGVNVPLRVYEALACDIEVKLDKSVPATDLSKHEEVDIANELVVLMNTFLAKYYKDTNKKDEHYITTPIEEAKDYDTQSEHTTNCVDTVLKQRASIYGSYSAGVDCRAAILAALNTKHKECNGVDMPEPLRIMFSDLALKMMRIASDPKHNDSYIDLAGYAKIIKEAVVK